MPLCVLARSAFPQPRVSEGVLLPRKKDPSAVMALWYGSSRSFHVEMGLSWRVGPDNFQSLVRTNSAVTDTGRKHEEVAGFQSEETAIFSA